MNQAVQNFLCLVADNGDLQEKASNTETLTDVILLAGTVDCDFNFDDWKTTIAEVQKEQAGENKFFQRSTPVEGHISGVGSISNESRGLKHFPDSVKA